MCHSANVAPGPSDISTSAATILHLPLIHYSEDARLSSSGHKSRWPSSILGDTLFHWEKTPARGDRGASQDEDREIQSCI